MNKFFIRIKTTMYVYNTADSNGRAV